MLPKVTERICEVPGCNNLGQNKGGTHKTGDLKGYPYRRATCDKHWNELHKQRTGKSLMESTAINAGFDTVADYRARHWPDNIRMLRFTYNGDENEPLKCLLYNEPLENIEVTNHKTGKVSSIDIIVLHHMLVREGASVRKSKKQEPSNIIRNKNLKRIYDKTLIELITCIPITPTAHKKIHAVGKNLDLSNYPVDSRPWVLRSKENFELFKKKYHRPNLDYQKVIDMIYLSENEYLVIKEEKEEFIRLKKEKEEMKKKDEERKNYFFGN